MNQELEADIRRALDHASARAPHAPTGLADRIVARSRRRRTRAQALVAALTVAAVAAGVGVAVRGGDTLDQTAVTPTPSPTATAPPPAPEPVEKVWPEAVWKIPAKLPDGPALRPRVFIYGRTLLLETWASFEKANALYTYDLATQEIRKIADIRTKKGVYASGYAAGAGLVVWQTIEKVEGRMSSRFWSVPISGGEPAEIRTDSVPGRADTLAVAGDRLAFSVMEGGVFTVPLGGGTVTPVPGADRYHILRWPFVGSVGRYTPNGETAFQELLNVDTGATSRAVVRPGEKNVVCGVWMCSGGRPDGTPFYRPRDGSQERDLPSWSLFGLAADRFMTLYRGDLGIDVLHDLRTGKSGDYGYRDDDSGKSIGVEPALGDGRLLTYPLGDHNVVIDLSRID
ncbi:hypothetical protein Aph01nite_01300 [Acrocarpospora phusangensis]|uniref:Uncharacterized protein n=1 Tax=Acrocarpospora phusangensis TaxID=1070424 RepID=A0A919Q7U2_9ACTN|nr:hypothetical protein [Acrocarpospora phusangensis]GIH21820.1 hypothetical protein Aph01nite_01300 [Acrocarpospora phusangensis]